MKKSDSSTCTDKNKKFLLIADSIRLFCEVTETLGNAMQLKLYSNLQVSLKTVCLIDDTN